MRRLLGFLALCLALAACAAPQPTRYQQSESEEGFGYSERWLDEATYEVRFAGNRLTERVTVETYALYRAAELALEKNYDSFAMLERTIEEHTEERVYYGSSPFAYGPYGWGHPYYYHPRRFGYPGYSYGGYGYWPPRRVSQTTFSAVATVTLYSGAAPDDAIKTYDAQTVIDELGPKVVRPEPAEAAS